MCPDEVGRWTGVFRRDERQAHGQPERIGHAVVELRHQRVRLCPSVRVLVTLRVEMSQDNVVLVCERDRGFAAGGNECLGARCTAQQMEGQQERRRTCYWWICVAAHVPPPFRSDGFTWRLL